MFKPKRLKRNRLPLFITLFYFCCFIGFDEELLLWERKLQIDCQKNGTYIYKRLSQPDGATVTAFFDKIGTFTFEMKQELFYQLVTRWLDFISQTTQKNIAEAMFKAFGKALDIAVSYDKRIDGVLSTKGMLEG